jgi:hypothetical protein
MSYHDEYYIAPDCPNCGEKDSYGAWRGARMGSSKWGHGYPCCSNACGMRLAAKLKNGMITHDQLAKNGHHRPFVEDNGRWERERFIALRDRIKELSHKLKEAHKKNDRTMDGRTL